MSEMKLIMENWQEYLNEDKKNNHHALLIVEAAETNNEDLFYENLIYLNEGILDSLQAKLFDKPVELLTKLIERIGEWVTNAFTWAASQVPDEWADLKTLANTISDTVGTLTYKITNPRMATHIASTLVKLGYIAVLFKAIAFAITAAGVSTAAGTAAGAAQQAASTSKTAVDVLQASLASGDPNSIATAAAKAIKILLEALKVLEVGKLLGYASGLLSPKRGLAVLGARLFKGDVGASAGDILKAMVGLSEYKIYREKVILGEQ